MASIEYTTQYIYIIQVEKDFGTNIYKIGKTTQNPFKRFSCYFGQLQIIQFNAVINCNKIEKELVDEFKTIFGKPVRGNEYFEGDLEKMLEIFNRIILSDITQIKNTKRKPRKRENRIWINPI